MRLLVLSAWLPYPPSNGSKIRAYYLLRALSKSHDVDLISFYTPGEEPDLAGLSQVARVAGLVKTIPYRPGRLRALSGYFSPTPRWLIDTFNPDMKICLQGALASGAYDGIAALQVPCARYAPWMTCPAVFDEIELTGLLEDWKSGSAVHRLLRRLTWHKARAYYRGLLKKFRAVTVVSEAEQEIFRRSLGSDTDVRVIANGTDTALNCPGLAEPVPHRLIYSGAVTYSANFDAVLHFKQDILPLLKSRYPQAELLVTGSTRGVDISMLQAEGIRFTGFVDDIRPVIASAQACLIPLRQGGGTRLKALEAMALGVPVISSVKGVEGLAVTPGRDVLIAADPGQFVEHVARLFEDPSARARLSAEGRALVERAYDWGQIGAGFATLLEEKFQG